MVKVVYIGHADVRELSKTDLAQLGVDRKRGHTFTKGVPEEVANAVAEAILSHPLVAGEFIAFQEGDQVGEKEPDTSGLLVNLDDDEDEEEKTSSSTSTGTASGGSTPAPSSGASASSGRSGSASKASSSSVGSTA